jgi:hypothetical protein
MWIIIVAMIIATTIAQQLGNTTGLECRWACDDPTCNPICYTKCAAPVCQASCPNTTICLYAPNCRVRCPTYPLVDETCPSCETICDPLPDPPCTDCSPLCEATSCSWECSKPTDCRYPHCELVCESPTCSSNGAILRVGLLGFILVILVI